ncbi:MAG TPA: glycosyltransferase family 4 protein [Candidatus Omnitrophota bacterium]|nr:glycosyltransferase family 4 protein [Candidatus Omnitrophota bacterium]HPD85244.1 glycosyltransferase family 4 protein [Candidatus Omnitrophota bacterium]HRZ04255.1 glycosyltransferase family 4 protein [Candidatus Omnitrophota bacterium]
MKILSVTTYDITGGAARAAYRLHQGLKLLGVDSRMLVQFKRSADPSVDGPSGIYADLLDGIRSRLDRMPLWRYRNRRPEFWSLQWLSNDIVRQINRINPDIVHFHWIGRGFVPITALPKLHCPLVWTLHDMWGFTGGCHYDFECGRWHDQCGSCPQLKSKNENDQSRRTWLTKERAWKNINIHIVTPSGWMTNCARTSSLFQRMPAQTIPYGINTEIFQPTHKETARAKLNLPKDRTLIIFGSDYRTSERRKGFHFLQPVLQSLANRGWKNSAIIGIFGPPAPSVTPDFGLKTFYLGRFSDEHKLSLVYSAGDIFLAPSIQDNLANTVVEALSCGTPCVAFNIGGMPDMIEHKTNGYLAKPFEIEDFSQGIEWILSDRGRHQSLCRNAREKILHGFTLELQAKAYLNLYTGLLKERSSLPGSQE